MGVYSVRGLSLLHQREQVLMNMLGLARKARVNNLLWGQLNFPIVIRCQIFPGSMSTCEKY